MDKVLITAAGALTVVLTLCMFRVIAGPTAGDRIIAVNVISTKTIVLLALIAALLKESYFLDVALVYGIISFTANFFIARELGERSEQS